MRGESAPVFVAIENLIAHLETVASGRVVLTNGCFDPLHVGHVRYLAGAAEHGDTVVVALNDDDSTRRLKGPLRPVVGETDRAALLAGFSTVSAVLIFRDDNVVSILERLRPHVHAKGTDYTVDTVPERETSARLGIETVIVGDPKSHASSTVLDRIRSDRTPGGE